jgi:hypothetical protein
MSAAGDIGGLLEAVAEDLDKLVNTLEQARSAPAAPAESAAPGDLPDPSGESPALDLLPFISSRIGCLTQPWFHCLILILPELS